MDIITQDDSGMILKREFYDGYREIGISGKKYLSKVKPTSHWNKIEKNESKFGGNQK